MSSETGKKERITFLSPLWTWYESDGTTSTTGPLDALTDKQGTATALATTAFAVKNRRVFYVNPDTTYVSENRDLATVKQSYVALVHTSAVTYGLYAKFTEAWVYDDGVNAKSTYYAGDDITDAVWTQLMSNVYGYTSGNASSLAKGQNITVDVPVPAYYISAANAGDVAGERPEQGHTNLPIAGDFSFLKYSGDYFSETQLNTIAGGGNYVMWQANKSAPLVSRHQLSTDISSVERQELSITTSVDFVAKFVRTGMEPYIGIYNITPSFLKLVRSLLNGMGTYLRREGYINDLKVDIVEQDSTQKDTILVTLSVAVKYPVNYIKITLQF
jgi:hypothetical protein